MKPLTLDDLTHDELLSFVKKSMIMLPRQVELLSIRHGTLSRKANALDQKWADAEVAQSRAFTAWLECKAGRREKNALDRIWLDLKDAAEKARKAADRARREEKACWDALQAEWDKRR